MDGPETTETHEVPGQRRSAPPSSPVSGRVLPRGVAQVRPEAPAAVLMVDLEARRVLYANEVAAQMAPSLALPVGADEWAAAADLRDIDGEPLDETAHPLSRIARFEPVAGQGVSAARSSDLGERREPLWVVALPLDDAPNLRGHALVVFLPVRDRDELQERAEAAHARTQDAVQHSSQDASTGAEPQPAPSDAVAVREAAVLATGLSFTVADAGVEDLPLVWVNPAFTAVTGYTFEQAVGHNCRFLQGPGTDRAVPARMRRALAAGEPCAETLLNYRADGTAFWNHVVLSPILDADGAVTHYVGIQSDVSGQVAADAERERAVAEAQQARRTAEAAHTRLQLLAEVSRQLSETVDPELALDRLARLVVPELGDFAVLAFVRDDATVPLVRPDAPVAEQVVGRAAGGRAPRHGLHDVSWWHRDPAMLPALEQHARHRLRQLSAAGREALLSLLGPAGRVVSGSAGSPGAGRDPDDLAPEGAGPSELLEQLLDLFDPGPARDAVALLAPSSLATFALRSRGRTLGLLTIGTSTGRAPMDADDLALGADIATRAGLALDRSRLFRQQRDLAEGLQRSLLSLSATAAPTHLDVAVRYVAAAEAAQVGGDFYDVFSQPGGAGVVVIGDVMGHDTQAAAAMAQLRSIVRTLGVVGDEGPARMLTRADEVTRALGVDTTATATVVRLCEADDGAELVLEWSNAGHPPPLVLHDDGRVETLSAEQTDLLLGIDPSTQRQLQTTALPDRATLLLYTDGLVERRDQPLPVGIQRLQEVAGAARCGADLEGLLDVLLTEMLPPLLSDDAALVAVRRR